MDAAGELVDQKGRGARSVLDGDDTAGGVVGGALGGAGGCSLGAVRCRAEL